MKKYGLHEKYGMLRSRISIIIKDLQNRTNVPIDKRISLLAKGFYSWHYTLYDLENNNLKITYQNIKDVKQDLLMDKLLIF